MGAREHVHSYQCTKPNELSSNSNGSLGAQRAAMTPSSLAGENSCGSGGLGRPRKKGLARSKGTGEEGVVGDESSANLGRAGPPSNP